MDFLFDNIGFFALLLYAAVVFASKIAMGGKAEDEPQQSPLQRRPQPRSPHDFPRPMPRRAPAPDPFEEGDFSDAQTRREIVNDSRNNAEPDHSPAAPCNQYAPEEPGETEYAPDEPPSADKAKTAAEEYGLNTAGALRRAFVASEILGKPKSLRKGEL